MEQSGMKNLFVNIEDPSHSLRMTKVRFFVFIAMT